jgi:hypothetical protein
VTPPRFVAAVLFAALLSACTTQGSVSEPTPAGAPGGEAPGSSVALRVMVFNIEYGGTGVDFDSVPKAIQAAKADVVGIEEGFGNIPRIAKALGWPYYDVATQVLSKYPLITPPASKGTVSLVEIAPGRVVAIGNLHLPAILYGPHKVLEGMQPDALQAQEEKVRVHALQPTLGSLQTLVSQGIPSFLMGDFNSPSALDWTDAMVGVRPQILYPFKWPTSLAVDAAGFRDSYRQVHPDPKADPGLTWPSGRPEIKGAWNPAHNAPTDRVDIIYSAGAATPKATAIIGGSAPDVDVVVDPWPSDHRATETTFLVTPGTPPVFVSAIPRLTESGSTVTVRFHTSDAEGQVAVAPATGGGAATTKPVRAADGALAFPELEPGAYEAQLLDASGTQLASTPLWVEEPGAKPTLATDASVYEPGQSIQATWDLAPGNRWDWLGVYPRGADPTVASYQTWQYTLATVAGTTTLDESARGAWPLPSGKYTVYLLEDDNYVILARADFTVRG